MKKIVIVEDQTAIRQLVAQLICTNPDYRVVAECGDGHSAYEQCLLTKPDLIVIDIMLPGLNGIEVLRKVSRQLKYTRILVFSGYENAQMLKRVLEAGAHGFVGKTASLSELKKGIDAVISGRNYFGPEIAEIMQEALSSPRGILSSSLENLTMREREILQLIAESHSTKDIAKKLEISIKTAENHRTNLMNKLDLHDVASLTRFAIEQGLVQTSINPGFNEESGNGGVFF